jgi:hypothetical protein
LMLHSRVPNLQSDTTGGSDNDHQVRMLVPTLLLKVRFGFLIFVKYNAYGGGDDKLTLNKGWRISHTKDNIVSPRLERLRYLFYALLCSVLFQPPRACS